MSVRTFEVPDTSVEPDPLPGARQPGLASAWNAGHQHVMDKKTAAFRLDFEGPGLKQMSSDHREKG